MGTSPWSLLLTGPIQDPADWEKAVQLAGWECHGQPLLQRSPLPLEDPPIPVPDWIAITSVGAVPALIEAREAGAEWCKAPLAAVGERSARALTTSGFEVALVSTGGNATSLAKALIEEASTGARVLWLRGERAQDFGAQLRTAEFQVDERTVYRTEPAPPSTAPITDVVFFAAPEAVELWCAGDHDFRPAALAIGWTTLDALQEHQEHFSLTLPLASPDPASLTLALQALATNE